MERKNGKGGKTTPTPTQQKRIIVLLERCLLPLVGSVAERNSEFGHVKLSCRVKRFNPRVRRLES